MNSLYVNLVVADDHFGFVVTADFAVVADNYNYYFDRYFVNFLLVVYFDYYFVNLFYHYLQQLGFLAAYSKHLNFVKVHLTVEAVLTLQLKADLEILKDLRKIVVLFFKFMHFFYMDHYSFIFAYLLYF